MKTLVSIFLLSVLSAVSFAQQHSAELQWGASSTAGITYTLNKGTASGQEAAFQSGLTTLSYTDTAVQPGATYYYTVVAVCGSSCPSGVSGTSAPTNEVKAVIPTNAPTPPGPLTLPQISMIPPVIQPTWTLSTLPNVLHQVVLRKPPTEDKWIPRVQLKPTITEWKDVAVVKGKTYGYEVEACNKTQCLTSQALFATVK